MQSKAIYLEWIDHRSGPDTWVDKDKFKAELAIVKSVVWLIEETDKYLAVAAHDGGDFWGCDTTIFKPCILKRKNLKT